MYSKLGPTCRTTLSKVRSRVAREFLQIVTIEKAGAPKAFGKHVETGGFYDNSGSDPEAGKDR